MMEYFEVHAMRVFLDYEMLRTTVLSNEAMDCIPGSDVFVNVYAGIGINGVRYGNSISFTRQWSDQVIHPKARPAYRIRARRKVSQ